jgi:CBS domain-containing protein
VRVAGDFDTLRRAAQDIRSLTQNLLAQGVAAEPLTQTIAALNDALMRRVIELAATRAPAGVAWCWLALGSEGRGEQTFSTDQDNALIFVAPGDAEAPRRQLLALALEVNRQLDALGFPLCKGNIMASNPDWCLSAGEWRSRFDAWIREPTPQALLNANIFFDFRPVSGESRLAQELRTWLLGLTQANSIFLRLMAQNALEVPPPLGVIRTFATEDHPDLPHSIDLKTRGTRIFVDAARVLALAFGVAHTGTAQRLREAGAALKVGERYVDATIEAFHFLQMLRLRQQFSSPGSAPNRIDPDGLNEIDQRMLKEALRQARKLQDRLKTHYQL